MASQDTEITLGMGKLLGLFFGLVALCAVFLGLGYSLGKNSVKPAAANAAEETQTVASNGTKPASGAATKPGASDAKQDLTFYKAVEQKDPDATLATPDADNTATSKAADPMTPKAITAASVAPEVSRPGSYIVQVAAVTKQEDAQALADALRKKSYAVQIATNPPNDKLYHVQVGPFSDIADAESTRNRLVGDGYNPILKK